MGCWFYFCSLDHTLISLHIPLLCFEPKKTSHLALSLLHNVWGLSCEDKVKATHQLRSEIIWRLLYSHLQSLSLDNSEMRAAKQSLHEASPLLLPSSQHGRLRIVQLLPCGAVLQVFQLAGQKLIAFYDSLKSHTASLLLSNDQSQACPDSKKEGIEERSINKLWAIF